jgi:hypothetical protein
MKIKCISDRTRGGRWPEKVRGLTEGKIYDGELVPIVWNSQKGTHIQVYDINFVIFNDDNEWCGYSKDFFVPVGE